MKPNMREAKLRPEAMVPARIPLVVALHESLIALNAQGASQKTIANHYYALRGLYAWADQTQRDLTISNVRTLYLQYAEQLHHRSEVRRNLKPNSAFTIAATLGAAISNALAIDSSLVGLTRLRNPKNSPIWQRSQQATLDSGMPCFGNALLRLSTALDLETLSGQLPIAVELAPGKEATISLRGSSHPLSRLSNGQIDLALLRKTRAPLINLRIEAELLIFLSQTGLNLEQVRRLERTAFRFQGSKSNPDFIEVSKTFKARRAGEVEFEINAGYKTLFDRYLTLRDTLFAAQDKPLLFEFLTVKGKSKCHYYDPCAVRRHFDAAGVPYRTPRAIRSYRENFLLDKTGCLITASQMMHHSPQVAEAHYVRPSFSSMLRDVATFQKTHEALRKSPGPGACTGNEPLTIDSAPKGAPTPNCASPAGCLFCVNRRDIDSMDHHWSMLSYRHLKSIELSNYRGRDPRDAPAFTVITRISEIVESMSSSSPERLAHKQEAEDRISEGWFHPAWESFINFAEGTL